MYKYQSVHQTCHYLMNTEKLNWSWINSRQFLARIFCIIGESIPTLVTRFQCFLYSCGDLDHISSCFFGNIRPWQRYKVIFFSGFFYGIHPSRVAMDLRLRKSQSVCTGAAPVVAMQASAGVTVPAAVLHLDVVLAGGACWLFLHLTLSSSDASCSCSSPLCRLQYSSCL